MLSAISQNSAICRNLARVESLESRVLADSNAWAASESTGWIHDNHVVDDYCAPFVTVIGTDESYVLGVNITNWSTARTDLHFKMPAAFLDSEGNALASSPGTLVVRRIADPATRFSHAALSGHPAAGENEYDVALPAIQQDGLLFGGTLNYGEMDFSLPLQLEAGETAFLSFALESPDQNTMILFMNEGWFGYDPVPNVQRAWAVTPSFTGELDYDQGYGNQIYLAIAYGATQLTPLPATPTVVAEPEFTAGLSNTVSWGVVAEADDYYVEWSTSSAFTTVSGNSGWITSTSSEASGLVDGSTYYFRVRARNAAGESAWSNVVSSTQDATGPTDLLLDNAAVPEGPSAVFVGNLASSDSDGGDAFTYTLVSGIADSAFFSIVGNQLMTTGGTDFEMRSSYSIRIRTADRAGNTYEEPFTVSVTNVREASVAGRKLFYNRSYFDGNNASANASDDNAIASNKSALLPGQTATFANYSSYSRGINGVMIDLSGFAGTLSADDFIFTAGNTTTTSSWAAAPAPSSIAQRSLAGGITRITLIWPDNAIQNKWLKVQLKASDNSDLASTDAFYFGNAIGETGLGNTTTYAYVNSSDVNAANNNLGGSIISRLPLTSAFDFNRDGMVNATDVSLSRNNPTGISTALKLLTSTQALFADVPLLLAGASGADNTSSLPSDLFASDHGDFADVLGYQPLLLS